MSSYITENEAKSLAATFQDNAHMMIGSHIRLYARDSSGNKTKLKSWFMDIAGLNELLADSQREIDPDNKTISGIRIYPALQDKSEQGVTVPDYHTLMVVATVFDDITKKHENILIGKVMEYLEPCPAECPSPSTDLL